MVVWWAQGVVAEERGWAVRFHARDGFASLWNDGVEYQRIFSSAMSLDVVQPQARQIFHHLRVLQARTCAS